MLNTHLTTIGLLPRGVVSSTLWRENSNKQSKYIFPSNEKFTWNQSVQLTFWQIWPLWFLIFVNLWKFSLLKLTKSAVFDVLILPNLISRKIQVLGKKHSVEKWKIYYTVCHSKKISSNQIFSENVTFTKFLCKKWGKNHSHQQNISWNQLVFSSPGPLMKTMFSRNFCE